jgi:PEGA domain
VALVLAIDPEHKHGRALTRLKRELAGHEVVIAGSSDEALDVIDQSVPDLVIFPLVLSPGDEEALTSRLRALAGTNDVQTLTVPMLASESSESAGSSAKNPRWFYWFKPPQVSGRAANSEPRILSRDIRASLRRGREDQAAAPPPAPLEPVLLDEIPDDVVEPELAIEPQLAVEPEFSAVATDVARKETPAEKPIPQKDLNHLSIPSTLFSSVDAPTPEAGTAFGSDKTAAIKGAIESTTTASWKVLGAGAGVAARVGGLAATGVWGLVKRAGSIRVPGTRKLWYVTPALVLSAGVGLAVGIPRAKAWLTAEAAVGVADLQSIPDGSEVFVSGKKIGLTPISTRLPAGKHEIEFHYAGVSRTETLDISAGKHSEIVVDWKRPPAGRLTVTSDPEGAAITIDGTKRGFTPLTIEDVPPGQHIITLKHTTGLVQRTVKVKANETATLDVTIYSGWLALFAPIEIQVSENGKALRLNEQNQVMLSPGRHDIELRNNGLGYRDSQVIEIRPGEVTAVNVTLPKTPVTITATPSSDVWLDGVKIGETPLADFPVAVGTREIVVKNSAHGERRLMTTVTVKPTTVDVDFTKP